MSFSVSYIFRKRLPKYFSIEGVFNIIKMEVCKNVAVSSVELCYSGASPFIILKNAFTYRNNKSAIKHITGDIHYMALFIKGKTVLTIHDLGSAIKGNILKQMYFKLCWFWLPALFVNRITVISHFTKGELEKLVPFAKYKIRVVHNPVNDIFGFSAYHFNKLQPRVLLIGTKSNKNLERVLKALSGISCEIVLIGQLTHEQAALLETLNLNFNTKFNLTPNQVVSEYKACDLLCFVSTYEGFGMPIIEAQAVGRPVVTSNLGAMKEVAADTAVLVDPYDVDAIRAGIKDVIENAEVRDRLIKKGLNNVERFKANAIAQDYMAIYKELSTTI